MPIEKTNKQTYRFFYHYYKQRKAMSVHYKGSCYVTASVECLVPCETHRKKTQPHLVMRGFASKITVTDNLITIT
jgi:hypothetical protein